MKLSDEEIGKLSEAVDSIGHRHMSGILQNAAQAIRQLKEERDRYKGALEWYAESDNYQGYQPVLVDGGMRTKQALGEDDADR